MVDKYLKPDFIIQSFSEVTPEFCKNNNIEALICDIDNTLVTYDDEEPTPLMMKWYDELKKSGISISFVSNNNKKRVARFNLRLKVPAFHKSRKPSRKFLRLAIAAMGSDKDKTVFLGDQLLTDVMAAKRLGIRAIVVPPIKDKDSLFFKTKRAVERPLMKKYKKQFALSSDVSR